MKVAGQQGTVRRRLVTGAGCARQPSTALCSGPCGVLPALDDVHAPVGAAREVQRGRRSSSGGQQVPLTSVTVGGRTLACLPNGVAPRRNEMRIQAGFSLRNFKSPPPPHPTLWHASARSTHLISTTQSDSGLAEQGRM